MADAKLTILEHPLIQHKLAIMRDKRTDSANFRRLCYEISQLMTYDLTRDLATKPHTVTTPIGDYHGRQVSEDCVLVPILRAGLGLLTGISELLPDARIGHIGLYRDDIQHKAVQYYSKFPPAIEASTIWLLDPMLATGMSACHALDLTKEAGGKKIIFVCLVAAPEGITELHSKHPDVEIFAAGVDEKLNEKDYITPGLGDAGDRLYRTSAIVSASHPS